MKVQITVLLNVDLNKEDYSGEDEQISDEEFAERVGNTIDEGNVSLDDLMERSRDYTITVVKGEE